MAMKLTSPAFKNNEFLPNDYTCKGKDISPPLAWSGVPPQAQSLALICVDPDAVGGLFVHWVLYDLPPDSGGLPEGIPTKPSLDSGAKQGITDFSSIGYGGPCPPPGKVHRYFFILYALDIKLDGPPGLSRAEVLSKIKGHILAQAELIGLFSR